MAHGEPAGHAVADTNGDHGQPAERRLVWIGGVVGEVLVHVANAPEPGTSVRALGSVVQAGRAFRVLATARRLGLPGVVLGRIGDDPSGNILRSALARETIELPVPKTSGAHGYSLVAIAGDGAVTRVDIGGIETTLTLAEINSFRIQPGDFVAISGSDLISDPPASAITQWVADGGPGLSTLVFAPGLQMPDIPDAVLDTVMRRTNILAVDANEFALITGVTDPTLRRDAARELLESLAPGAHLLIRVYDRGCWLVRRGVGTWFPAPSFAESTGNTPECALAAHLGIFLAELARLGDPEEAARIATIGWTRVPAPSRSWLTAIGPNRHDLDELVASQDWGLENLVELIG